MKRFFLDSNVLLGYPRLLSSRRKDAELIIPDAVLREVQGNRGVGSEDIGNLIQNAKLKNYVSIETIPPISADIPGDAIWSAVDYTVIQHLKKLRISTNSDEIIFVTDDKRAAHDAKFDNIVVWSASELVDFYKTPGSIEDKVIRREASQVENKVRWSVVSNILLAIIILTFFVLVIRNYGYLVDSIENIVKIIILIILSCFLFEVREKRRQLYGFVEIGFGILTIVIVFYPRIISNNWDQFSKIAAGLYVIVRGLDNLYKGSENRKLGLVLKKIFRF